MLEKQRAHKGGPTGFCQAVREVYHSALLHLRMSRRHPHSQIVKCTQKVLGRSVL